MTAGLPENVGLAEAVSENDAEPVALDVTVAAALAEPVALEDAVSVPLEEEVPVALDDAVPVALCDAVPVLLELGVPVSEAGLVQLAVTLLAMVLLDVAVLLPVGVGGIGMSHVKTGQLPRYVFTNS